MNHAAKNPSRAALVSWRVLGFALASPAGAELFSYRRQVQEPSPAAFAKARINILRAGIGRTTIVTEPKRVSRAKRSSGC
jgi:hypothetical protein